MPDTTQIPAEKTQAALQAATHAEAAEALFFAGYNCAQSVAGAFWRELGLPLPQALALSAGLGGGFARLREMCGAVSGMVLVMGAVLGQQGVSPSQKPDNYRQVQAQIHAFEAENGSYLCRNLLGLPAGRRDDPAPAERTPAYYAHRPCVAKILCAVRLTESWLAARQARDDVDAGQKTTCTAPPAQQKEAARAGQGATGPTQANACAAQASPAQGAVPVKDAPPAQQAALQSAATGAAQTSACAALAAPQGATADAGRATAARADAPCPTDAPGALDAAWYDAHRPRRDPRGHKGSFGKVLAVCGSASYRGAAALCCEAALRSGAGLVQLAAPPVVCAAVAARRPEVTFLPLEAPDPAANAALAVAAARGAKALVLGCGLGRGPQAAALVAALCVPQTLPAVLDADALDLLAATPQPLQTAAPQPRVLTPHIGEMARLLGVDIHTVLADQAATARRAARDWGSVVVLKSSVTVIAAPDGRALLLDAPNSGLAKGGSGDLLAGLIAGALAQGLPAFEAAACGVWQHSTAARRAASARGEAAMLPSDLLEWL